MPTETIGFAIEREDRARLEALAGKFAGGNRSRFLRVAMNYMEAIDRAERLRSLQSYGTQRAAAKTLTVSDVEAVVYRVLGKKTKNRA